MAEPSDPLNTPLLDPNQNQIQNENQILEQGGQEDFEKTQLENALKMFDVMLGYLGFHQSSVLSRVGSWSGLVLVGIVLPVVALQLMQYQIKDFEPYVVASQALLAAVSLSCISHNLAKYGINKFLTLGRQTSCLAPYRKDYAAKIQGSRRWLLFSAVICFGLKVAREAIRILHAKRLSWGSVFVFLAMTISWTYLSLISLTAAIVFHLMCDLQILHLDGYAKLLKTESDVLLLLKKHIVLCRRLSKISHIFGIFLLLEFLFVAFSQCMTLFQTMTFINSCGFVVSAIVQMAGIILCLRGATRISHRAQEIASEVSRWHALITCGPDDVSQLQHPNENSDATSIPDVRANNVPGTDLDSLDIVTMLMPTAAQLASSASYHKREAFVKYLQMNPGGITIFGWTVDRDLVNDFFFIELTLITFVLGKTLVVT